MKFLSTMAILMGMASTANAASFWTIPVSSWDDIQKDYPVTEGQKFCEKIRYPTGATVDSHGGIHYTYATSWVNCSYIVYRASAPFGQRMMVVVPENIAAGFLKNEELSSQNGIPNAVSVVAVANGDSYKGIYSVGEPREYPPRGLPPTDPEIGYKMLYCTGSAFACGGAFYAMMESGTGIKLILTMMNTCAKAPAKLCGDFAEALKKEQTYYEALEKWHEEHGIKPTPFDKAFRRLFRHDTTGTTPTNPNGTGGVSSDGGNPPTSGTTPSDGSSLGTCVGTTIGMGGGPAGPYVEESGVDCYD